MSYHISLWPKPDTETQKVETDLWNNQLKRGSYYFSEKKTVSRCLNDLNGRSSYHWHAIKGSIKRFVVVVVCLLPDFLIVLKVIGALDLWHVNLKGYSYQKPFIQGCNYKRDANSSFSKFVLCYCIYSFYCYF